MWTAGAMHHIAHAFLNIPVNIRDVCVFTAPLFAGLTSVVTFLFTKECWNSHAGYVKFVCNSILALKLYLINCVNIF